MVRLNRHRPGPSGSSGGGTKTKRGASRRFRSEAPASHGYVTPVSIISDNSHQGDTINCIGAAAARTTDSSSDANTSAAQTTVNGRVFLRSPAASEHGATHSRPITPASTELTASAAERRGKRVFAMTPGPEKRDSTSNGSGRNWLASSTGDAATGVSATGATWSPAPRPPPLTSTSVIISSSVGGENGRQLFPGRKPWTAMRSSPSCSTSENSGAGSSNRAPSAAPTIPPSEAAAGFSSTAATAATPAGTSAASSHTVPTAPTVVPMTATESEPHAPSGGGLVRKRKASRPTAKACTGGGALSKSSSETPTTAPVLEFPMEPSHGRVPSWSRKPEAVPVSVSHATTAATTSATASGVSPNATHTTTASPTAVTATNQAAATLQLVPQIRAVLQATESCETASVPGTPCLSRTGSRSAPLHQPHAASATVLPGHRSDDRPTSRGSRAEKGDGEGTLPPVLTVLSSGGGSNRSFGSHGRNRHGGVVLSASDGAGRSPGISALTRSAQTLSAASAIDDCDNSPLGTPESVVLGTRRHSPAPASVGPASALPATSPVPLMSVDAGTPAAVNRATATRSLGFSGEGEPATMSNNASRGISNGSCPRHSDSVGVDRERAPSRSPAPPEAVSSTASVAAATAAYVPSASGIPRELRNFGATCYMNATLQCLLHTDRLICGLEEDARRLLTTSSSHSSAAAGNSPALSGATLGRPAYGSRAAKERRRSYLAIHAPASSSLVELARGSSAMPSNTPTGQLLLSIKGSAATYNGEFSGNGQNDAHEFLRTILYVIHDEVNKGEGRSARYEELRDVDKETEEEAMARWMRRLRAVDDSTVYDTFGGVLRSRCECLTCGHVSLTFDPFLDLSLPVSAGSNGDHGNSSVHSNSNSNSCSGSNTTVPEAVDLILRESYLEDIDESLSGGNQLLCEKCKKLCNGVRRSKVLRWPQILVLHLKRFDDKGHKNRAKIVYPQSFMLGSERYRLYAVCCHSGTESFGHYTSYVSVSLPAGTEASGGGVAPEEVGPGTAATAAEAVGSTTSESGGGGVYARRFREQIRRWYLCNDNHISEVDAREAASALERAYILFYCSQPSHKDAPAG